MDKDWNGIVSLLYKPTVNICAQAKLHTTPTAVYEGRP